MKYFGFIDVFSTVHQTNEIISRNASATTLTRGQKFPTKVHFAMDVPKGYKRLIIMTATKDETTCHHF